MKYTRVLRFFCLIVTLTGTLFSVSFVASRTAYAAELTLQKTISHEGLTVDTGLAFASPIDAPVTVSVTFMTVSEAEAATPEDHEKAILVQNTEKGEVLAEEIIIPTPKKQLPTTTPTPTVAKKATPTSIQAVLAATTVPTMTPTPQPTKVETPVTPSASSLPAYATNGTLSADTLFSMVNQKRSEAGLPAFEKHPEVCSVAEARKPQLENEVYGSSSIHAGFRAMDIPFRASENMISQNSEEAALNWWMNSSVHRGGVLGNSKYACVVCQNKTCAMIMSSLEPK